MTSRTFGRWGRWILWICAVAALTACEDRMKQKGRVKPLEPTAFFADGMSSRPLVPDTVPQGGGPIRPSIRRDYNRVTVLPVPLTMELLQRGRERYNMYCSMCHGATGYGDGMVVRRGFTRPPSYHEERLRTIPIGHFVDVITNGYGAMFSQNDRVTLEDRWAIAAYIRALQLSQHTPMGALSPQERQKVLQSNPDGGHAP